MTLPLMCLAQFVQLGRLALLRQFVQPLLARLPQLVFPLPHPMRPYPQDRRLEPHLSYHPDQWFPCRLYRLLATL